MAFRPLTILRNPAPYNSMDQRSGTASLSINQLQPSFIKSEQATSGSLILNADDWGRDFHTTQRILECRNRGTISSTSAMVFMEDSERAASLACERGIDSGLHLNFTTAYTARNCSPLVVEHQRKLVSYLNLHSLAQVLYHPGLARSFEFTVKAQIEEFALLYGRVPERIDGHHHMHLCANVLYSKLIPPGTLVRRNFSFRAGEKSLLNRLYRKTVDRKLAQRHRMVDYLFLLPPLEPRSRLERIRSLACQHTVEVETHPINPDEYAFLTGGDAERWAAETPIALRFCAQPETGGFTQESST